MSPPMLARSMTSPATGAGCRDAGRRRRRKYEKMSATLPRQARLARRKSRIMNQDFTRFFVAMLLAAGRYLWRWHDLSDPPSPAAAGFAKAGNWAPAPRIELEGRLFWDHALIRLV